MKTLPRVAEDKIYITSDDMQFKYRSIANFHQSILDNINKICPNCNGKKRINSRYENNLYVEDVCSVCDGKGYIHNE